MRRVLSWKRFLIVLGVLLTASAATYGLHVVQVRRQADGLKDRADVAARDGKPDEAAALLENYLRFRPKDAEALRRYSAVMLTRAQADSSLGEDAARATEAFLRQAPDLQDVRKQLIDLYVDLGRLQPARQHLRILFDARGGNESDPDLLDKAATCELGLGDPRSAVEFLDRAVESTARKAPPRVFDRLLGILRTSKDVGRAHPPSKYLEWLTLKEPYRSSVEARMVAARHLILTGDARGAGDQISAAQALPGGSTNADVLLARAELELAEMRTVEQIRERLEKAEGHLRAAFQHAPRDVRVGLLLAQVLHDRGKNPEAVQVLRTAADGLGKTGDAYIQLVDRLIDLGEKDVAGRLIEKIEQNAADKNRIGKYLRGRMAVLNKDWARARADLEEAAPALTRTPEYHKKAMFGLGLCYEILQNPDKQLEYFTAALADDYRYFPAVVGHAEALLRLGKFREAMPELRTLVNGWGQAGYRPRLARLELRAVLTQPPTGRNWDAFETSLGPAADRTPELQVIYAESLLARGEKVRAEELLTEVIRKDPRNAAAWLVLTRVSGTGGTDGPLAQLIAATSGAGDTVDARLCRAVVLVNRAKKPTPGDLTALAAGADKFEPKDRQRLWFGLGEAAGRAAATADATAAAFRGLAIEYYQAAAALDRNDLIARATLIDLGVAAGRRDVVDAALAGIAEIEGPNGPYGSLGRVVARLPEVTRTKDPAAIAELRGPAERAMKARPQWGRALVALAQLDDLSGLYDAALAKYKEAIERGERQEFVVRRAVELHRERRQDDQAAALLNSVHTEMRLPDDLERFRTVKDLLSRDLPSNERPTVDRIAPADSKDWRVLLLRGSLLVALGDDPGAEAAFRGAVALGDNVPETWGALVAHLVRVGRVDDAKRATQQAEARLKANPPRDAAAHAELIITLAGCHELAGDLKTAEARYRDAVAAAPRGLNPTRQVVLFLQRTGRGPEALAALRKLSTDTAQDLARWARRHLALTLIAGRDGHAQHAAALALVEENLRASGDDPEDRKAKAVVLTADPATRAAGIKTLQDFAKWGDLTPDEFFLLGRLLFNQGKLAESVEFFEKAARPRPGLTAEHLTGLIRVNLGINRVPQARAALARLKAYTPRGWEPVREEARILHREATDAEKAGDKDRAKQLDGRARDLILNYPGAKTEAAVRQRTGPLLEELGYAADAEAVYTRLLADGKEPHPHVPLAAFLVGQKRAAEAIALARRYEATTPPAVTARILTGAVRAGNPGPTAEREVADWLDAKLAQPASKPDHLLMLGTKAELLEARGLYDDAIRVYEAAIAETRAARPEELNGLTDDPFVNNLCMTLALARPDRAGEAVERMKQVVAVRGPVPAYLDTLAVAYIVKGGQTDEAVSTVQLALAQQQRPSYLFHLAWAYDLNPSKRVLREQPLDDAKRLGLTPADLHPLEARKFGELYQGR